MQIQSSFIATQRPQWARFSPLFMFYSTFIQNHCWVVLQDSKSSLFTAPCTRHETGRSDFPERINQLIKAALSQIRPHMSDLTILLAAHFLLRADLYVSWDFHRNEGHVGWFWLVRFAICQFLLLWCQVINADLAVLWTQCRIRHQSCPCRHAMVKPTLNQPMLKQHCFNIVSH